MSAYLSSTKNTRYILSDNKKYVRSDVPVVITANDKKWLLENDIRTVIDLREDVERQKKPCPLRTMSEFTYLCMPVTGGDKIPEAPSKVPASYIKMVNVQMAKIVYTIENAPTNVLYFCNAGKDRTGVVSALLLKRIGRSEEEIIADYVKSAENLKEMLEKFATANPSIDLQTITPKEEYMREFLQLFNNRKGIKPEAVIFDMDGVIFDTERLCLDSWKKVAKENGLTGIQEAFYKCIGTTMIQTKSIMMNHYGDQLDYESFREQASVYFHQEEAENGLPIKKGVLEILKLLREKEIPIGLASSTSKEVVEKELKDAGLYPYFQMIIGGDLLKRSKPEPDIYLFACKEMNVEPENTIAIEDSYNGIRSAYGAGMHPIMVPDLISPDEEMITKSDLIVKDLLEIMSIFERQY